MRRNGDASGRRSVDAYEPSGGQAVDGQRAQSVEEQAQSGAVDRRRSHRMPIGQSRAVEMR